jgi:Sugar phosphate isomerases/epimerases
MNRIGVQTKNLVEDNDPDKGFGLIKQAGFDCADFSLNQYLMSNKIYARQKNRFFDKTTGELERFFAPHKKAADVAGVVISQMHMPYPLYIWEGDKFNEYLAKTVAPKSLAVCAFLGCPYIVLHGFKLTAQLGAEEEEWRCTEDFLRTLAPIAKETGITVCLENLYDGFEGRIIEGTCDDPALTSDRIDRLNGEFGAEVFGFCFDTGHANLLGIDFESFITKMGSRIKVLHIHDNDGIIDLHQIPFTFTKTRENTSSTDWSGFIKGLKAIHYQGVLNFETSPVLTAFPTKMMPDVLGFIAKIGKYFADEIVKA